MSMNPNKTPILYSVGTSLAYKISKRYYNNVHFVWCTSNFHSLKQPPTSNPLTICRRYLEQIAGSDRHTVEIEKNISGILAGAKYKLDNGIITDEQYKDISMILSVSEYESFYPVLYIIYSNRVKSKCVEVSKKDCASDASIEYKIAQLEEDEFDVIFFKVILNGLINVAELKVGE